MKKRLESIQALRAIAFILVFLSHTELTLTGPAGVSLFLMISGFCMTYAYLDRPDRLPEANLRSSLAFAKRRIQKLYPLHLVTLLMIAAVTFGSLLLHHGKVGEFAEQGAYFVSNLFLLQSWIPWRDGYFSFNAVSWYLSTAAFSYLLFHWIFRTIQSRNSRRVFRLGIVVLLLMAAVSGILTLNQ